MFARRKYSQAVLGIVHIIHFHLGIFTFRSFYAIGDTERFKTVIRERSHMTSAAEGGGGGFRNADGC